MSGGGEATYGEGSVQPGVRRTIDLSGRKREKRCQCERSAVSLAPHCTSPSKGEARRSDHV